MIRWTIGEPFRIPSGSMEPTFHGDPRMFHGDRVFVNKLSYGLRYPLNDIRIPFVGKTFHYASTRLWHRADPKRWDIVVFKAVEASAQHGTLVKRVVGLPGERIHIAGGKVFVNGEPLKLPPDMPDVYYTSPGEFQSDMKYGILPQDEYSLVPPDCYLLLGDNSDHSRDGRYFGWAPSEHILGRVSCIWWPIGRWRDFTGFSTTWWWQALVGLLIVLVGIRLLFGRSFRGYAGPDDKSLHYYINRWAFGLPVPFTRLRLVQWGAPKRGELVLYHTPGSAQEVPSLLVGRVAGLSGERVSFEGGVLTIDGARLQSSPSLVQRTFPSGDGIGPYGLSKSKEHSQIPPEHYYILAETSNPNMQIDSRILGWIPRKNLVGTAVFIWWPITRWRRVRP